MKKTLKRGTKDLRKYISNLKTKTKLRKILRRKIPERTKKTLRARAEKRMR
jgi:hypothetical protein